MKYMGFLAIFQLFEAKRSAWLASLIANLYKIGDLIEKTEFNEKKPKYQQEKKNLGSFE